MDNKGRGGIINSQISQIESENIIYQDKNGNNIFLNQNYPNTPQLNLYVMNP